MWQIDIELRCKEWWIWSQWTRPTLSSRCLNDLKRIIKAAWQTYKETIDSLSKITLSDLETYFFVSILRSVIQYQMAFFLTLCVSRSNSHISSFVTMQSQWSECITGESSASSSKSLNGFWLNLVQGIDIKIHRSHLRLMA